MLSKKQLSLTFSGLFIFSLISVILTFIVWNAPVKLDLDIDDITITNVKGNVERCYLNNSSIYAKGWIFATNEYPGIYKGNTYVALNELGTLYKIKTVRENRPDVTTHFKTDKKKYDLSGYSASSNFVFFGLKPSKEIYIITEQDGVIRGMKHECN